ncbi:30S ribosomal protein S16 [Nocardioides bigeumensis]|uniref:Small ribosomal subunit protein bS16 n=1 Tax=Nocardioides bigeumensis TaxID=433657 RepID=A0ABP5JJ11_9ACTN
MSVKIRLKRLGKIRVPQYRIVVVDSRKKRDGRVIEEIGKYHPKEDPSFIEVVSDRAQYWLGVGAQPSEPVAAILKVTGDWQKFKGEPGAEGTLRVKEPKRSKLDVFNEALKDAQSEPRGEAVTKKAAAKKSAPAAEKGAEKPAEAKADEAKADEAKADEAKADEAVAETPAETPAQVPASETPEGAAEEAEAAETVTAEDAGKSES